MQQHYFRILDEVISHYRAILPPFPRSREADEHMREFNPSRVWEWWVSSRATERFTVNT